MGNVRLPAPGANKTPLTEAEAALLLADLRAFVLDQNYERAGAIAGQILDRPSGSATATALELLGLIQERRGDAAGAVTSYRRYLADYSGTEGAIRVGQRLAALATARDKPRESLRSQGSAERDSTWELQGGLSQFYRLDSVSFGDEAGSVSQSAFYSDADLQLRRDGERFSMASRATVGYTHDLSGRNVDPGNATRVYNLYADLADRNLGLSARLGRQALRNQGVLGRFDGAYVSWQATPSYRLNVLAGYPVYSYEDSVATQRVFYGASIDLLELLDRLDVNVYANVQEIDGVNDRQALGTELRYLGNGRSLVAAVDYDTGYKELNNVSLLGNWTLDGRVTFSASADRRRTPYLTTEGALAGQPAGTIQDLLRSYSEAEIRQLALDRAGTQQSIAVGANWPLSERFQLGLDATTSSYEATPNSGGVRDTPDSGTLSYAYVTLMASSLLREGDISIFGLRYADGGESTSQSVFVDARYPIGRQLRLNPKLLISRREFNVGGATDILIRPGLRLLYRTGQHFQFELEGGGEFGNHSSNGETSNATAYYLYVGYSADF
jgi:hypothetical protein